MTAAAIDVRRPVIRWFGGKWILAPWIIAHFRPHRVYVEAFGGGGSVLLRKPRAYAEVYNDLDGEVVKLFRVLRAPDQAARLVELLRLTPFAREEFDESYSLTGEPVEDARRFVVRSLMGYGANAHNPNISTGFRSYANQNGRHPAKDWMNYPDALALAVDRLRGVTIEHRDALAVMAAHDDDQTLHYVDPPYLPDTRGRSDRQRSYVHELTFEQHAELLTFLRTLKGMVVLSGYPHPMYDTALHDWRRVERPALADGARARTEVLWINRAANDAGPLFAAAGTA